MVAMATHPKELAMPTTPTLIPYLGAYLIDATRPDVSIEHGWSGGWHVVQYGLAGRMDQSVQSWDTPEDAAAAWESGISAWESNR